MAVVTAASIQALISQAEGDSEFEMTGTGQLSEALGAALSSLENNFGMKNVLVGPGGQGDAYAKMFAEVAEGFSSLRSELTAMRSSYLPFELVQDVPRADGETMTLEEIVDTESMMESYENTFFRMLGMPSTADLNVNEPLINIEQNGTFVFTDKQYVAGPPGYMDKLDLRQQSTTSRPGAPTNEIYNFLKASQDIYDRLARAKLPDEKITVIKDIIYWMQLLKGVEQADDNSQAMSTSLYSVISNNTDLEDALAEPKLTSISDQLALYKPGSDGFSEKNGLFALLYILPDSLELVAPDWKGEFTSEFVTTLFSREILKESDPSLQALHETKNFFKYNYMLFPPVQDGRIAKCINEASKMVAPPFSPKLTRTVNNRKLKSTLLEAILRIRLDTISGTTINAPNLDSKSSAPVTVGASPAPVSYEQIANSMGILESLIIARLFTAVHGFALDVKAKIATMKDAQHKSGYAPAKGSKVTGDGEKTMVEKQMEAYYNDGVLSNLHTMRTIEESLLLLFGDNDVPEALELQEGVVRNAGVRTAHLMSATMSIIDVPRRWIEKQIDTKGKEAKRISGKSGDKAASTVASIMGIAKGVGAIDILAFLIAFFTAKEETLICLLTEDQFADLEKEFPDGFFNDMDRTRTIATAVNDITLIVYDVYQLFRYTLNKSVPSRVNLAKPSPDD